MFGYSSELRERTRGCGTFVMRFNHYRPVRQAEEGGTPESFVRVPLRPFSRAEN
jgi:translation elongation factor EF-G